jgi:hypothetical protein
LFAARSAGLLACALAVLVTVVHAGCASLPPQVPTAPGATALGRVAVVAGGGTPEIKFEGFVHGRAGGAAIGSGVTFLSCVSIGASSTCAGPFCGPMAVLWLGVCGAASVVGGVAGAVAAPSAETVRGAEARLHAALDVDTIHDSLRQQIELAARAHGAVPVSRKDADTLLEASIVRAGTAGAGIDAPIELRMRAQVRLLRAATGEELYRAEYTHLGERLKLAQWAEGDGEHLLRGLERGYAALATHIAESLFLLYPLPEQQAGSAGLLAVSFGLAPIDPKTRGTLTGDRLIGDRFEWTRVGSLQPTLRWEAFPREAERTAASADMARVENVAYDLVLAREENLAPSREVYRREGLPQPEHRVETMLQPGARYFWTVRARFTLDGATRVTGWGATHHIARESMTVPSPYSYRFRTPDK